MSFRQTAIWRTYKHIVAGSGQRKRGRMATGGNSRMLAIWIVALALICGRLPGPVRISWPLGSVNATGGTSEDTPRAVRGACGSSREPGCFILAAGGQG